MLVKSNKDLDIHAPLLKANGNETSSARFNFLRPLLLLLSLAFIVFAAQGLQNSGVFSMEEKLGTPPVREAWSKYGTAVITKLKEARTAAWQGETWWIFDTGSFFEGSYRDWFFVTPLHILYGKSTSLLKLAPNACDPQYMKENHIDVPPNICREMPVMPCDSDADCTTRLRKEIPTQALSTSGSETVSGVSTTEPPQSRCVLSKAIEEKICDGHSIEFVDKMYDTMASATELMDVALLSPPWPNKDFHYPRMPDGLFMTAIQNAVKTLNEKAANYSGEKTIHLRFLLGLSVMDKNTAAQEDILQYGTHWLNHVTNKIPDPSSSKLKIDFTINLLLDSILKVKIPEWNHAKIICADGIRMITGGHNMWDVDYLNHAPISDISVAVSGTVAQSGHEFLNEQWREAMNHGIFTKGARWQKGVVESLNTFEAPAFKFNTQSYKDLLATIPPLRSIPMIAIGRNGGAFGDDDTMKQSSDHALLAFFDSATTSIKFSIQDFGAGKEKDWFAKNLNLLPSWEEKIAEAVIKAIMKEVMVDALLSGKNAKPANGEHSLQTDYGHGWDPEDYQRHIFEVMFKAGKSEYGTKEEIIKKVCTYLRPVVLKYNDDEDRWNDYTRKAKTRTTAVFGNHAKLFIVDDSAFYVGSQNIYPSHLGEFGVIVDDKKTTKLVLEKFWTPVWKYSYEAISSQVNQKCVDRIKSPKPLEEKSMLDNILG